MAEPANEDLSVVFSGKIGEVVHVEQPDGRVFEKFRRPPGVRLVIVSPDKKLLITKEFRSETSNYDLRLPGGKVCDSLDEYHSLLISDKDMLEAAKEVAIKESLEETGLQIQNPELITIAKAGATVEWDLYYFLVKDYTKQEQKLEVGEDIEVLWLSIDEVKQSINDGKVQEWRSVGVLLGRILPKLSL
jgi:8-oxo-dGTP pyrophosphatase MutT (NUDIX family)